MTDSKTASMQVTPYFAPGELYPSLIGVKADGDEHELAYVKKSEMAEAVEYWRRMYREAVNEFDYQSKWHCSKTASPRAVPQALFDYQSKWHCSKTMAMNRGVAAGFDYQSKWHCSKTDNSGKRSKQIDMDHVHLGVSPHAHDGYYHSEFRKNLTTEERAMVDRAVDAWDNYKRKQ